MGNFLYCNKKNRIDNEIYNGKKNIIRRNSKYEDVLILDDNINKNTSQDTIEKLCYNPFDTKKIKKIDKIYEVWT